MTAGTKSRMLPVERPAWGEPWSALLRKKVRDAADSSVSGIRRVEVAIDGATFHPAMLDAAPWFPRMFWRSREGGERVAATGEICSGTLTAMLARLGDAASGVRVLGGSSFDLSPSLLDEWESFPARLFFIPRVELIERRGGVCLALNLLDGADSAEDCEAAIGWVRRGAEFSLPESPTAVARWDAPHFDRWQLSVVKALELAACGEIEKVVLARKSRFELESAPGAFGLCELLAGLSPRCFHYCIEPTPDSGAFLGASPELLFRRRGRLIESEAVAGTRPRSLDAAEDERLQAQLVGQKKEREEHRVVVAAIESALGTLCESLRRDAEPQLLKLSRIQHLRTTFSGLLREGVSDADVLAALHPTPATCGLPIDRALAFLRQVEPFDRGWYAGPIGLVGKESSEFAVAIRSMRLRGPLLDVFAGAGIVPGSNPEAEWGELESKIGDALRLLAT